MFVVGAHGSFFITKLKALRCCFCRSQVVFEVKPWEADSDLKALFDKIRKVCPNVTSRQAFLADVICKKMLLLLQSIMRDSRGQRSCHFPHPAMSRCCSVDFVQNPQELPVSSHTIRRCLMCDSPSPVFFSHVILLVLSSVTWTRYYRWRSRD